MMDWQSFMQTVETVSVLAGIALAISTFRGNSNSRASTMAVMQRDIEYIKKKVDELPSFRERLTAVEESAKQAHKRIDRMENKEG